MDRKRTFIIMNHLHLLYLLSFQESVFTLDGRASPSRASTESLGLLSDLLTSDNNWTSLVLEVIGLMCDGQHHTLQDYLREQPDNFKVNNTIHLVTRLISLFVLNQLDIFFSCFLHKS